MHIAEAGVRGRGMTGAQRRFDPGFSPFRLVRRPDESGHPAKTTADRPAADQPIPARCGYAHGVGGYKQWR
jgi:hypothetical protein